MSEPADLNPTLVRFEYPALLVRDYEHWAVTLRRHQVTLGSLVLIAKAHVTAWPDIGSAAFAELGSITAAIERSLKSVFGYDKINYLMLMMADPNVHFHVLPRYGRPMTFEDVEFPDAGWPKVPDLGSGPTLDDRMAARLKARLQAGWAGADRPA